MKKIRVRDKKEELSKTQKVGITIISILTVIGIFFGISLNFILPDLLNDSVHTVESFEEIFSNFEN